MKNKNIILGTLIVGLVSNTLSLNEISSSRNIFQKIKNIFTPENVTNLNKANKFLEENKKKDGVIVTPSGLQYEILKQGKDNKNPKETDKVKVHYIGTFIDGIVFDSSVDRGEPATFPLNGIIPGLTEGLQLMTIGSKFKFYIPPNLAYGEESTSLIPPNSLLIFEVELLDIQFNLGY